MDRYDFANGYFTATPNGACIDFEFMNYWMIGNPEESWDYMGHKVVTVMEIADKPDMFTVIPASGWEVVTEPLLHVAEWTSGIITVCNMLMS